jgi:hypothetical protein
MDVWKGERRLSLKIVRGRDKTAFIPSIPQTAKRWSKEDSYVTDVKELWMSGLLRSRFIDMHRVLKVAAFRVFRLEHP